jgi:hypothetical protein
MSPSQIVDQQQVDSNTAGQYLRRCLPVKDKTPQSLRPFLQADGIETGIARMQWDLT